MSERHEQSGEQLEQSRVSVEKARAAVVATEQAVRVAVERAREVTLRLERLGSGRHLSHELVEIEVEIDSAWQAMHEAEQRVYQIEQAQQAEVIKQPLIHTRPDPEQSLSVDETFPQKDTPAQQVQQRELSALKQSEHIGEVEKAPTPPRNAVTHTGRIEQIERIEHIDEEEEMVEMGAAMTAADVAAAAAAEAEAFAEASSARVREMQRLADQADRILERVRLAVQRGVLVGDAAESTLYEAEHDATHAHALLAESEATEERARRSAMNAEAEAEVAEGMARATQGRFAHEDYRDAGEYALDTTGNSYSHKNTRAFEHEDAFENGNEDNDDDKDKDKDNNGNAHDAEDTLELPSIHLRMRQNHKEQQDK